MIGFRRAMMMAMFHYMRAATEAHHYDRVSFEYA
jgi:hypothetical protein